MSRARVVLAAVVVSAAFAVPPVSADHKVCDGRSARPASLQQCREQAALEHWANLVGWRVRHLAWLGAHR